MKNSDLFYIIAIIFEEVGKYIIFHNMEYSRNIRA